jgi:hypothetical protein
MAKSDKVGFTLLSRVHVDSRWFPLLLQRWPTSVMDDDLDQFFSIIDDAARRAEREGVHYACVVLGPADLDVAQRRRVAKWVRGMPKELRHRNCGSFVVVAGPVQRGVITALRWIVPELRDVYAVDSIEAGIQAALSALRKNGVRAPGTAGEIATYVG